MTNTNVGLYERSAVFPRIQNILRITVRYSASHISAGHAYTRAVDEHSRQPYWYWYEVLLNKDIILKTSTTYHIPV